MENAAGKEGQRRLSTGVGASPHAATFSTNDSWPCNYPPRLLFVQMQRRLDWEGRVCLTAFSPHFRAFRFNDSQDDTGAGGTLSTPATPPMIDVTRSLRPALAAEGFECGGCAEPAPASGNKNAAGSAVEEWDRPESFEFLREFVSNTENTRGPLSDRSALKNAQQPHRPVAEHEYPVRGTAAAKSAETVTPPTAPRAEGVHRRTERGGKGGGAISHANPCDAARTPAAATGSAKSPRPPSPISSPKPALALRGGDHLSACSGARGSGGAGEAGAVDRERAGGVQTGGGTGRPRALSEDGVLARACRSFGVEGGLESMEEDSADVKGFSALAAALEGSSSSLSPSSSSSSVAAATSTSQLPLNLVDEGHTIVLLDLETTGLRPKTDRVIQLAAKVRRRVMYCMYLEVQYSLWTRDPRRVIGAVQPTLPPPP